MSVDEVRAPLAAVDVLWDGDAESTAAKVKARFLAVAEARRADIPLLTRRAYALGRVAPRALVRWVGMVQDMGNPEFYAPCVGSSVEMFRDAPAEAWREREFEVPTARALATRQPLFCVAAPAQSAWVVEREALRSREAAVRADCDEDAARLKRAFSDCERDCDYDGDFAMTGDATRDAPSVKRHDGETAQGAVLNSFAARARLQSELAEEACVQCVARIYGAKSGGPKLNTLVELVGVLGGDVLRLTPSGAEDDFDQGRTLEDDFDQAEWDPPSSTVARLHVLAWRPLPSHHPHELAPSHADSDAKALRANALDALKIALDGDAFAAEYALLGLVSRVSARVSEGRVLGALSLELVCKDARDAARVAPRLATALSELVPRAQLLRTSEVCAPKRRAGSERLAQSPLQLTDATLVTVLCEALASPVSPEAAQGVRALRSLVGCSKSVPYHFGFHETQFELDAPAFVIAPPHGHCELGADCRLPLIAQLSAPSAAPLSAPQLDALRGYIAAARLVKVSIGADVAELVQRDFLQARAAGKVPPFEAEQRFHLWLTLACLVAKTEGATVLQPTHWTKCVQLETDRQKRLAALETHTKV